MVAGIKVLLAALLPVALACNGYTGGVPKATSTKTNSKVIIVKAGTTYDGKWARFDRGAGACGGQSEGGLFCHLFPSDIPYHPSPTSTTSG
jgi:hypothetical protein